MSDPSEALPPPIIPSSEGDDEWQIVDGTASNVYRSINESESDNNAAIESAAMAAADDNPLPSIDHSSSDPSLLHQRKNNSSSSSSSSSEGNDAKKETVSDVCNEKICRICQDGDNVNDFISPCRCKGSMKYVHSECLEKWRNMSANPKSFFECDQCKYKYHFSRTRAGDVLASKWSLHILTFLSMLGLVIVLGYLLKLLNMITPASDDEIIVEVNERGDIIIKNATDISSPPLSTLSRFYQFIRIDFYHLLYGTVFLGLGGFISLVARGGALYHFGGGWRSGGSSDRTSSALEMVIIGIIVLIGLVKASFSVYEMVEKRVNKGLLTARQMVINIPEGS